MKQGEGLALDGRVAVVTGGASGIGAACVRALLDAGAQVAVLDVTAGTSTGARLYHADVSQSNQVEAAFEALRRDLGEPTLLVNNAGIMRYGSVTETTEELWDAVMATNLKGAFLCARAAIPSMQRAGSGAIVNMASVQSFLSEGGVAAYTTGKTALIGLTRSIAIDYAPAIRCNAVCPGAINTPMLERAVQGSPEVMDACVRLHLAGRIGTPEEVAALVVYLLSDQSAFVTGQAIRIDGGMGLMATPLPPSGALTHKV